MLTGRQSRKVLLFLPPYEGKTFGPPLGLLSLAAALRSAGFEPKVIDGALDAAQGCVGCFPRRQHAVDVGCEPGEFVVPLFGHAAAGRRPPVRARWIYCWPPPSCPEAAGACRASAVSWDPQGGLRKSPDGRREVGKDRARERDSTPS